MRRTKDSHKAHLLGELSSTNKKRVLATRGTRALVEDYKRTNNDSSSISVLPFMGVWLLLSLFLWFVFLDSIFSLAAITSLGLCFIFLVKKFLIPQNYQIISKVEKRVELSEAIEEFSHLFSTEIKEELAQINNGIEYLQQFSEHKILSLEQEHYLEQCKYRHLIDLINGLKQSHQEHLQHNQINVLEQLRYINEKIKKIISTVQYDIDVKIKIKSALSKDH